MGATPEILVIEDEQDLADMVRVNLELAGHTVRVANDGAAGLEAARDDPPDLVLLDVMMPVLDGWGVLENLAALDAPPRVIVVSAKAAPADVARAYRLGASDYVTKPFSIEGLIGVMRDVLDRSPEEQATHRRDALEDLGVDA